MGKHTESSFLVFFLVFFFLLLRFITCFSSHVYANVRVGLKRLFHPLSVSCAQIPVKNEEIKTICCLCCQSGPITAVGWLPKSGFVPGETILFCGTVDNRSGSRLHQTAVRLVEVYRDAVFTLHCNSIFVRNRFSNVRKRYLLISVP